MYATGPFATASYGTPGVGLPVLTVNTNPASNITGYTVRLNGSITDIGFDELEVTERGFIFGTSSDGGNPGTYGYGSVVQDAGGYGVGAFFADIESDQIDPDTTYYYRAYAINADGTKYGAEVSFTTTEVPTVDTQAVVNIKPFNAVGVLEIIAQGDYAPTKIGFVFDTVSRSDPNELANPTPANSGYDAFVLYPGSFSETTYARVLSGLTPNTTYYVRGFAYNQGGYGFGDEVSFTTGYAAPVILSVSPAGLLVNEADAEITITGNFFRDGATVEIDGVACTDIVVVDPNTITCTAPTSVIAKDSVLTVTNDDDQSDSINFFYIDLVPPTPQPSPVVASFSVKGVAYLT